MSKYKVVPISPSRNIEDAIGRARNLSASEIWEDALAAVSETGMLAITTAEYTSGQAMTTNKPEVVTYIDERTAHSLVRNHLTNAVCYSRPHALGNVPLIRLSDYEALRRKCDDACLVLKYQTENVTTIVKALEDLYSALDSAIELTPEVMRRAESIITAYRKGGDKV